MISIFIKITKDMKQTMHLIEEYLSSQVTNNINLFTGMAAIRVKITRTQLIKMEHI